MRPLQLGPYSGRHSVSIPIGPKKQKALKYESPIELRLLITNMKAILFDQFCVKRHRSISGLVSKLPSKMGHFVFYTFFFEHLTERTTILYETGTIVEFYMRVPIFLIHITSQLKKLTFESFIVRN